MPQADGLLREIPQVDKLMKNRIIAGCEAYRHETVAAVRAVLSELRRDVIENKVNAIPEDDAIAEMAVRMATRLAYGRTNGPERGGTYGDGTSGGGINGDRTSGGGTNGSRTDEGLMNGGYPRRLINGTGVILHSNFGRACLPKAAAEAAYEAALHYSALEYDLETGGRGDRAACIEGLLKQVTGCESAAIVNNNAAAVLLALTAVASGGNIVVSRGELVEIGGGFRVPEIMALCGCSLREVGTTNKTRIADYSGAIDENTRAIMKVHTSNYKIVGFTESVPLDKLAGLAGSRDIPLINDLGSGALANPSIYGLHGEPFVSESLALGADVVTFSGDKLLGGPQCGLILGRAKYVSAMRKHPLYRALRTDKMTIAALAQTLRLYGDIRSAQRGIPALAMLSMTGEALRSRADGLCEMIGRRGGFAETIETSSIAGCGSVPGLELDSYAVSPCGGESAMNCERRLRALPVPIIGRIEDGRFLLDVRALFEEDFGYIADALAAIGNTAASPAEEPRPTGEPRLTGVES